MACFFIENLFFFQKISKDNAWAVSIIDTFSKLIRKHHKSLQSFQVAGSTLEASTKVYGLRVDSVYNDVIRMSSELSRQTAKALRKRLADQDDDDDEDDENQENNASIANGGNDNPENREVAPPKKKQKKRRNISTVTKNKESLNAKLDTVPFTDPFFAKLNSIVGDINSSKRLMENIIPTHNSVLKLRQDSKFWDSTPPPDNFELNRPLNIEALRNSEICEVVALKDLHFGPKTHMQGPLKGYLLSDQPIEDDEDETLRQDSSFNQSVPQINNSHIDLQFDINAEVEPITNDANDYVMDFGDMDHNEIEELDEEQRNALNRCKMLKRKPIVIENEQPQESMSLEYSYRPLDNLGQFWAGPSHWKFRRTTKSLGMRMSYANRDNTAQSDGQAARKKRTKKNFGEFNAEDLFNFPSSIEKNKKKIKSVTLTRQTLGKKWDPRKLKLPTDYKVDMDICDHFKHSPNFKPQKTDTTLTPEENPDYNYDNNADRDYCTRVGVSLSINFLFKCRNQIIIFSSHID